MKVKSRLQAKPGMLRKVTVLVSVATIEKSSPPPGDVAVAEHVVGGALLVAAHPEAEGDDAHEVDGEDGEVEGRGSQGWAPSAREHLVVDDLQRRGQPADLVVAPLLARASSWGGTSAARCGAASPSSSLSACSSVGRKPLRVAAVTLQKPPAIWFAIAGQLPPIQLAISSPPT